MSNYDKWLRAGEELLRMAEETQAMRDTMLVSPDGKTAIFFPCPFDEKEIQAEIEQLKQQLETAKRKHEARAMSIVP